MILGLLIENYIAGGSDKIAKDLINNLKYEKLVLFVNTRNDMRVLLSDAFSDNISIVYYPLITLAELEMYANTFRKRKILFYTLKIRNFLFRYPLIVFSFFYFRNLFKIYKIDAFISNNGGYPGGEYNRSSTLAAASLKLQPNIHIIHNIATRSRYIYMIIEFLYDRLLEKRSQIICVSDDTSAALLKNRYFKIPPIVIYNGIKSRTHIKKKLSEKFVLLNVASLEDRKNQIMLLEVMKILLSKGIVDLELYLVGGDGDKLYAQQLRNFVSENNMEDYIHFTGFANPEQFYDSSDLFVFSSKVESFALVRVEAMNSGLPVITTDVGNAAKQIIDGKNGYIVNNAKEMADKVLIYYYNRLLLNEHGRYSENHFKKYFQLESMINQYQNLLSNYEVK